MKSDFTYKKITSFLLINVLIALVIWLFFSPKVDFTFLWLKGFLLNYFLYSFLIATLLSGGINVLIEFSGRQFSWIEAPVKRLMLDLTLVVSYSFVVSFVLSTVFAVLVWDFMTIDNLKWHILLANTKLPILIALGFTFFFTSRAFL